MATKQQIEKLPFITYAFEAEFNIVGKIYKLIPISGILSWSDNNYFTLNGPTMSEELWDVLHKLPERLNGVKLKIITKSGDIIKESHEVEIAYLEGWRQVNNMVLYLHSLGIAFLQNPTPEQAVDNWELKAVMPSQLEKFLKERAKHGI